MRVGDVDLAVKESGEGTAVVLVHGFTGSKEDWSYVAPTLARHFHVVSYDHRGHGESAKPDGAGGYSLDVLADDLGGLLDALELDDAHLVGHSMGGVVVMRYLLKHGTERAVRVVLSDTFLKGRRSRAFEERLAFAREHGLPALWEKEQAEAPPNPLLQAMPDVAGFLRDRFLAMSEAAFVALGEALLDLEDLSEPLRGIDLPVLVVCGERDDRTPPASNRELAGAIPGAMYREIAHAGHTPQVENVAGFLEAVLPFLRGGDETPP